MSYCSEVLGRHRGLYTATELRAMCKAYGLDDTVTNKSYLAAGLAEAYFRGRLDGRQLLLPRLRRGFTFFRVLQAELDRLVPQNPIEAFFDRFPEEGWYGPIDDADRRSQWLVRVEHVSYIDRDKNARVTLWYCFVEYRANTVVIHWDGMSLPTIDGDQHYPAWESVPLAMDELVKMAGLRPGTQLPRPLDLKTTAHSHIWDKYRRSAEVAFETTRAYGKSEGCGLDARAKPLELKVQGIQAIVDRLAQAVEQVIDVDPSRGIALKDAIEHVLVRTWGNLVYELRLFPKSLPVDARQPKNAFFVGRFYFGNGSSGPYSLSHIRTYYAFGASTKASWFLLGELGLLD